jgi:hypothetical protein
MRRLEPHCISACDRAGQEKADGQVAASASRVVSVFATDC